MKTISTQLAAAIDAGAPRVQLFRLELKSATVFLTTGGHDLHWDGDVYRSTGLMLKHSKIKQSSDIRVGNRTLTFTAADPTLLAEVSNNTQVNRFITQYEAYLDSAGAIIPDPIHKHTWLYSHEKVKGSKLEVTMSNEWALFETTFGRHTTTESQKRFFPDDKGFDYAPDATKEIMWGRS
ncbi:hypothetical protein ACR0ST_04415 [Aliidiomarina sp. Khilg15.8]